MNIEVTKVETHIVSVDKAVASALMLKFVLDNESPGQTSVCPDGTGSWSVMVLADTKVELPDIMPVVITIVHTNEPFSPDLVRQFETLRELIELGHKEKA